MCQLASLLLSFLPPHTSNRTLQGQSLGVIAQSSPVHLTRPPGADPKRVSTLDHGFEKPFHMGAAGGAPPTTTYMMRGPFDNTLAYIYLPFLAVFLRPQYEDQ
ncbi:hypothetical protein H4582DRAFT_2061194 [Lactarius indigo]|nr:hypothetical protein H4582DRAFT_2061194 [Lactarius indigo]